jgi:tape measure domain-containing protein
MADRQVGNIVYLVQMDVQQLLTAQRQVNARLDRLDGGFDNTTRAVKNTEKSMLSLSRVALGLASALSIQQVAKYAEAWTVVNNKLANSIKPHEDLGDAVNRVFNLAQSTRTELGATASLYSRLERATRQAGTSTEDLARLTTIINQAFIVSGATAQEAESAIIQLSQGLASGTLRGEEYNSVNEQGNRLIVALSESLGVGAGKLREMAFAGKLTTDVVVNGLLKQGDAIGKEFANTVTTMGQAFSIATNNITKFVGESSTIKSAYSVFNNSVVTVSENLELMGVAITAAAVLFGSRYVGALAASAKVTVTDAAAKIQNAKATEAATGAELRKAQAAKAAASAELTKAQSRAAGARVTASATTAEIALADAEVASVRTNIAQIEAEKALEVQRLRAQITDQGRIATMTRMAQLQQASAALSAKLAQAETAAIAARTSASLTGAAAVLAADAKVSAARVALANATGLATAANVRYQAASSAASIATAAVTIAVNGLRSALTLLGGPAGIITIIAAGWYLYAQRQAEAKKESIAFANTLPDVIAKLKEMNLAQAQGVRADTVTSIKNQKEAIADLQEEVASLSDEYNKYSDLAKKFGVTNDENNGYVIKATEAANKLAQANRDLDSKTRTLAETQDALSKINIQVNQGIVDQMKAARDNAIALAEAERKTSFLGQAQGFLAEKLGQSTTAMAKFNAESLKINWGGKEGDKLIKQAERKLALSKLEGKAKAELQAAYDAEDAGVTDQKAIDKLKGVYAQTEANTQAKKDDKKATSEQNAEAKKAASQAENVAQKLENLKQQTEQTADSTQELSREQAILAAKQSLGKGATQEQIDLAGKYRAEIWDTAAALKARNAVPELKENADYASQKAQLDMLQGARDAQGNLLISQEQFNQQSEQLEQQHQTALAQIKAGQAVTPQQEALGTVDPVQALANEHAKKLALIQAFETQKGVITANGLALMNAANMEYEQQRLDAQWALWENQSEGNQILAGSFESLAGNASNTLTGIITKSMEAEDALRSIGSNALNSLINGFVQMGVDWVKSAITGAAAQQTAIAATTTAQVAGIGVQTAASTTAAVATTAAWTPAAIMSSIASFGGAVAIGFGAIAGVMALSGKRKNGGPVSAGSMYQVGEGGKPEIYQASTGKQYMIPGDNGKVISNKDMQGGSSPAPTIIIHNYSGAMVDVQATQNSQGGWTIEEFIADMNSGGRASQAVTNNTTARRVPRGQG